MLALLTACGGSGGGSGTAPRYKIRAFPVLRIETDAGADSLDPGLSYTNESWQSLWNVYLSPLGYQHTSGESSTQIVPALAEKMPEISSDGRVYEFRLRKGLRYSNGKRVLASDFAYAIRRLYLLDSLGAPLFDDIVGAGMAAARRGPISGIQSDDIARTVKIRLKRPSSTFLNALASLFAAPVPQRTPGQDQTRKPIPSTGPYEIVQVRWPKEYTLVRNRYFKPTDTLPRTNPDRIVVSIVGSSREAYERLVAGQADYANTSIALTPLEHAAKKGLVQLRTYIGADTYYFFMNTTVRPFNDIRVRQAVNYALDRNKLARIFGDQAVPTENILPPAYPSYEAHNLYPYNIWRARALVRRAKAVNAPVTIYGLAAPAPARAALSYLAGQLAAIGLKPSSEPTLLPAARYWSSIGNSHSRAQIGYAFWIQSIPNPYEWFQPLLSGGEIEQLANTNYSLANIKELDSAIERLGREPELTADVNAQWASLDRMAMHRAPIAPFVNLRSVDALGPLVDLGCYTRNVLYGLDYGRVCMRS